MVVTRRAQQESTSFLPQLPVFLRGHVEHGMGRGGKDMGIPTGETCMSRKPSINNRSSEMGLR